MHDLSRDLQVAKPPLAMSNKKACYATFSLVWDGVNDSDSNELGKVEDALKPKDDHELLPGDFIKSIEITWTPEGGVDFGELADRVQPVLNSLIEHDPPLRVAHAPHPVTAGGKAESSEGEDPGVYVVDSNGNIRVIHNHRLLTGDGALLTFERDSKQVAIKLQFSYRVAREPKGMEPKHPTKIYSIHEPA